MAKNTLSRRDFIKAAGFAAGAGLLAACAPQQTATPVAATQGVAPTTAPENVTLEVWWNTDVDSLPALANWAPDPENEFFKKNWNWGGLAFAKYMPFVEAHPGVSLNIKTHGWDTGLRENQLLAIAAGLTPDTTYGEAYVNEFVQLGVYNPVSADKAALFADGTIRGATLNGKQYGLPKSSGADVLFINLDLMEKAGLDPTKLPTNWEELVTLAQAISEVNESEQYGHTAYFTYGPDPNTYGTAMRILHWFNQNNVPLASDVGTNIQANGPGAADTWAFHNDLLWTSSESVIAAGDGEGGSNLRFNQGIIGLKVGWGNDATAIGDGTINATAIEFPLPPGGKPATIVIGNDIESPLKNGKHPELGIALIEETVPLEEAQAFLADNAGIWLPATKSLLDQWETYDRLGGYKTDLAKSMVRTTMKALVEGGSGPIPGWPKNGSRIWAEWNNSYQRIYQGHGTTADIQAELDALQTTLEGLTA
jgi:ABC-type glycerol-3-phosphate transport system substrate-binding protein